MINFLRNSCRNAFCDSFMCTSNVLGFFFQNLCKDSFKIFSGIPPKTPPKIFKRFLLIFLQKFLQKLHKWSLQKIYTGIHAGMSSRYLLWASKNSSGDCSFQIPPEILAWIFKEFNQEYSKEYHHELFRNYSKNSFLVGFLEKIPGYIPGRTSWNIYEATPISLEESLVEYQEKFVQDFLEE